MHKVIVFQRRTQGEAGPGLNPPREFRDGGTTPTYPLATNQTKIPYPKHSNKTKLRLNESKKNSLKTRYISIIKTHFVY